MADEMTHIDEQNPEVHHEESDINVRAVLIGTAITGTFFVVTAIGLWGMYVGFRSIDRRLDPEVPSRVAEPATVAPGVPEFTTHWSEPAKYLEDLQKEDRAILEEYGWMDRTAGRVHVPIEVGMEMALERGYPTRPVEDPVVGSGDATPHDPWVVHPTRAMGVAEPTVESATAAESAPAAETGTSGDATVVETEGHSR